MSRTFFHELDFNIIMNLVKFDFKDKVGIMWVKKLNH
jgi:hypothetical protein